MSEFNIASSSSPSGSRFVPPNTLIGNLFSVLNPCVLSTVYYPLWSANSAINNNGEVSCAIFNISNNQLGTQVGQSVLISVSPSTKNLLFDFRNQKINLSSGKENYAAIIRSQTVGFNLGQIPNNNINATRKTYLNGEIMQIGLEFTITGTTSNNITSAQMATTRAGTVPAISLLDNSNENQIASSKGNMNSPLITSGKKVGNIFTANNSGKLARIVYPFKKLSNDGYVSCMFHEIDSRNVLGKQLGKATTYTSKSNDKSFTFVFVDQNIDILKNKTYAAVLISYTVSFVLPQTNTSSPSSFMDNSIKNIIYEFTVYSFTSQLSPAPINMTPSNPLVPALSAKVIAGPNAQTNMTPSNPLVPALSAKVIAGPNAPNSISGPNSVVVPNAVVGYSTFPTSRSPGSLYLPTTSPNTPKQTIFYPTTFRPTLSPTTLYPNNRTDGLFIKFDAANAASYTEGRNVWTDIASGRSYTFTDMPTYSKEANGSLKFSSGASKTGNIDPFFDSTSLEDYSLFVWLRYDEGSGNIFKIIGNEYILYDANGSFRGDYNNTALVIVNNYSAAIKSMSYGGESLITGGNVGQYTWTHIACTSDKNESKIYINGALTASGEPTRMSGKGIGIMEGSGFIGSIGEISLYSRKLSDSQISEKYNSEKSRYPQ